jgi:hypothetical protein
VSRLRYAEQIFSEHGEREELVQRVVIAQNLVVKPGSSRNRLVGPIDRRADCGICCAHEQLQIALVEIGQKRAVNPLASDLNRQPRLDLVEALAEP